MHLPKFRTLAVAVAVGLFASLLPMAAASAADDIVEWASTDGEPVPVTTTTPDQKAHIFFSGTAGRHLIVTCDTQQRSGPTYVLLAADGTQIGPEKTCPNTLSPLDINPLPVTGRYRLLMRPTNGQTFATTTKVLLIEDVHGTMSVGGASVELTSSRGEQNLVFEFSATAGSRVMVKCKSDGLFPTYRVVGPNGKLVASDIGAHSSCGRSNLDEGPLVDIPATGTYRFVAAQATTSTPRPFKGSAAVVPVEADATAPVLTDGTPLTLTTTSALQRAKATFSLSAYTWVYITCERTGSGNASVNLYSSDGRSERLTFCQSAGVGTEPTAFEGKKMLADGDWRLLIDPWHDTTNAFTIRVHRIPNPVKAALPLDGTPVTLSTVTPGQNAVFSIQANAGDTVYVGCRLSAYREANPWTYDDHASIDFTHPDQWSDSGACRKPTHDEYPSALTGYPVRLNKAGVHNITVGMRKAELNDVTLWAYRVPAPVEAEAAVDGTPTTVELATPGQDAVVRVPVTAGQRLTISCDATGAQRHAGVLLSSPTDGWVDGPHYAQCGPTGSVTTAALPETGKYQLSVRFKGDGTGPVKVTVRPAD